MFNNIFKIKVPTYVIASEINYYFSKMKIKNKISYNCIHNNSLYLTN